MTKDELQALNAELIEMLVAMRDQIDEKLDELAAVEDDDEDEDAAEAEAEADDED